MDCIAENWAERELKLALMFYNILSNYCAKETKLSGCFKFNL